MNTPAQLSAVHIVFAGEGGSDAALPILGIFASEGAALQSIVYSFCSFHTRITKRTGEAGLGHWVVEVEVFQEGASGGEDPWTEVFTVRALPLQTEVGCI